MRAHIQKLLFVCSITITLGASAKDSADIHAEMTEGASALGPPMQDANAFLAEGRLDEINRKILATFPEGLRTSVQALLLGNVLFRNDPQVSYALHKRAAADLRDEPLAQLEWAMEQHRAGEFEGAAGSYAKFVETNPRFGPALGLLAECLVRTGRIREGADAWMRSEQGSGSLEQLESWVCELHTHAVPDRDRAAFMAGAKEGDLDAAEKMVSLDCDFEQDWWNRGPKKDYLLKDLQILREVKFKDQARLAEIKCAAECGRMQAEENGDVGALLRNAGLLVDAKGTLPKSARLLAPMVAAAESRGAISSEEARQKLGPAVLERAKATHDPVIYNVAAHLYLGTEQLSQIDQAAWDDTGDARFAASLLIGLANQGTLQLDDPRLVKAVKQFPEDSELARIVVSLRIQTGKPMKDVLVSAIKAEYSHFSYAGGLIGGRPSAASLRAYFKQLSDELQTQKAKPAVP